MTNIDARDRVILALDCPLANGLALAESLGERLRWVKVGLTTFYEAGPEAARRFKERGLKLFLDLKLHDIPHQVRGAARAAARTGADLLTVHALGGPAMVAAAREGAEEAAREQGGERTRILGVTVLTSMDANALAQIGVARPLEAEVDGLASLARGAGADGIVCSPVEAAEMRALLGPDALIVCPGVRPAGADALDQSRVATPAEAIARGASHIVVGRPVTQAADPVAAFEAIVEELESV